MSDITRRDALKHLGVAGAGLALSGGIIRGQSGDIIVGGKPVEIAVSSVSANTVRITVLPIAAGGAATIPADGALAQADWGRALARARTAPALSSVKAGNLVVKFAENPSTLRIETASGQLVQTLVLSAENASMTFSLPKGPLLGGGEGGPQFDRKGVIDNARSGQGGYMLRTHGARVPIQWWIGTDGWALYIHQPLGRFDFTGEKALFTPMVTPIAAPGAPIVNAPPPVPATEALPLDVFVTSSTDPAVLMREYARITGLPEMPARWTLGYMQSHRTLSGADEVLSVARTFREKKLPVDAVIYLGTDFTPSGWNTHNGEFTWNEKNFPDPKKMVDELHAEHLKVILHIVIEGQRFSGAVSDPCTMPPQPTGRFPNGQWPVERQASCYWPAHKPLFDLGVDGWWPDQGDGYDYIARLARIRMYWEGSQLYRPNERPFALHRNGYAGMQRYAGFLWSGDIYTTWDTLKAHVPIGVNTGLSGIPYWGTDIGGFVPTKEYTGELHVRWFQFGAFCPLFRAHGRTWHLRLPWGWNTGEVGVSEVQGYTGGAADPDPSELHNAQVEPIVKKYLELRYRLMPYLYSAVRETSQTGLPIMRALWLHYPDDPAAAARGTEYLWGRDILVAPVIEKGATSRTLYLPRGAWFDFWTEERTDGGREITRAVDLETMPLYVRAGAIVPMGPIKQYAEEPIDAPLTLVVYPGADGTAMVYDDDGKSFAYRGGAWMGISVMWKDATRQLTLQLAAGSRVIGAATRAIDVRVAGATTTQRVTFAGRPVTVTVR